MNDPYFSGQSQPAGREPTFDFRDLPPSDRLSYQLLTWENYGRLQEMFGNDTNAFVDERFKSRGELRQYVQYQMEYAWYSPRRGGCDWFFLKDGQPAGVLHLYDLTRDQTAGRHRRCTIGFATARPFRRQGLTREATGHLLTHLFHFFGMDQVCSYTRRDNTAAIRLLERLRFESFDGLHEEDKEPQYRYFLLPRERHAGP